MSSFDIYLRELRKYPVLSREEEIDYARRTQKGDKDARELLINHNLRFVISAAKKYQNRGLSLHDLVQEGNVGLVRAVDRYDPERGVKLISYAIWYIRQAIGEALAEAGPVRIPIYRDTDWQAIFARASIYEAKGFSQKEAKERAIKELSEERTLKKSNSKRTYKSIQRSETQRLSDTYELVYNSKVGKSFDEKIGIGARRKTLHDSLSDDSADTLEILVEDEFSSGVHEAVSHLPKRDEQIINMYFGLNGYSEHTLEQIGDELGITRERVRQVKEKALSRLKNNKLIQIIKENNP